MEQLTEKQLVKEIRQGREELITGMVRLGGLAAMSRLPEADIQRLNLRMTEALTGASSPAAQRMRDRLRTLAEFTTEIAAAIIMEAAKQE